MSTNLDTAKRFVSWNLKRNVKKYLRTNYDWKVSKSISTGIPLAEEDIEFRRQVLLDFDMRIARVEAAETLADLDKIRMSFKR